ncbi:DNA mismatch repair protein MutS [Flavobacteriaceae bacterium]|nr:DNA mismatch repair protein MutS [Flavobacteriaceae bacterium]
MSKYTVLKEDSKAYAYYAKKKTDLEQLEQGYKKQLLFLGWLRLFVFLVIVSNFFTLNDYVLVLVLVELMLLVVFILILRTYFDKKDLLAYTRRQLVRVNDYRKGICYSNGEQFIPRSHDFAQDLDLLGPDSFFEKINFTSTQEGEAVLAEMLLSNKTEKIELRQSLVEELSQKNDFRLEFFASSDPTDASGIYNFLKNYRPIIFKWSKRLTPIFSIVSILLIGATVFGYISYVIPMFWAIIGLGITGLHFKSINEFSAITDRLLPVLKQQVKLLCKINDLSLESSLGNELMEKLGNRPDLILKELSEPISRLDQRNNMLMGIVLNGFMLWDIWQMQQIQSWLVFYEEQWKNWRYVLQEIDAFNSLAEYTFQNEDLVFPELNYSNGKMEFEQLGHPLINTRDLVCNDLSIEQGSLWVITGPNMAGKSTFLRAVGMAVVMSNIGLPVRAKKMIYQPIKLISSMRTSDSLMEQSSYFHAELHRLKYVLDHAIDQSYFVLLDEILKGTNSTDKAEGSFKFLEKIHQGPSTVFVATHDLSLGGLIEKNKLVFNYYFEAVVADEELVFDYKLRSGLSQNRNASHLMRKMGLLD